MGLSSGLETVHAADGTPLAVGYEIPEHPKSVCLVVHGIASHQGWYRGMAVELAAAGFAVVMPDRRGAGRSGGERGHMSAWPVLLQDLQIVREWAARRLGPLPVHGIGVSLGGVIVTAAEVRAPGSHASVVMFAPGFASSYRVHPWRALRLLRRSVFDPTKLYTLPFGAEELTGNRAWQEAIRADPLRGDEASARFLTQLFRMQKEAYRRRGRFAAPVLTLLAGNDRVVDNTRTLGLLAGCGSATVATHHFADAEHMIPAALPPGTVTSILLEWLGGGHAQPGRREFRHPPFEGPPAKLARPPVIVPEPV